MIQPNTPHLEAQLQSDMDLIRSGVVRMATLDGKSLGWALQAFVQSDRQLAYSVILRDQEVDRSETELDKLCLTFLLRHQPVAGILRFVYSASKIVKELERVGDYAESIARQVLPLSAMNLGIPKEGFQELAGQAILMLHNAVRAFAEGDATLARATMASERSVREQRDVLTALLQAWRDQDRISLDAFGPLTTIVRRFERVMEQAINICEETIYSVTGEYLKHHVRHGYRVLFIGSTNACVSQMAEAIARAKAYSGLTFMSAGVTSGSLDPQVVQFLAGKGISCEQQTSKRVEQLPELDQVQVAVALTAEAERAFPLLPKRALKLTWFVPEPSALGSTDAYDRAFRELETQIQDLANAILIDDKE